VARDRLQRGLMLMAEKGGMSALRSALPEGAARDVDKSLNSELADFGRVTASSTGGVRLFQAVEGAARVLAYYDAMQGTPASTAANRAVQGILLEKWEMSGTMMYPKGMGRQVAAATSAVTASLTPALLDDVPASPDTAGMTDQARQDAWLRAAKAGEWVPNKGSTGLVLMAPLFNGARIPVRMANGDPVEVLFEALPGTNTPNLPAVVDVSRGTQFRAPAADPLSVLGGGR